MTSSSSLGREVLSKLYTQLLHNVYANGGVVSGAAVKGGGGSPAAGVAKQGQDLIKTDPPCSQQYH